MTYESKYGVGDKVLMQRDNSFTSSLRDIAFVYDLVTITAVTFYEGGYSYDILQGNRIYRDISEKNLLSQQERESIKKFASYPETPTTATEEL